MVDRLFYLLLAILPGVLAIGGVTFARQAILASQPGRRARTWLVAATFFGACVLLLAVRSRIRGWQGLDSRAFDIAFIGSLACLVVVAAALGLIAAIGRSTRGVALCPTCWYDMSAHEGLCPECGTTIRSEAELVRRKRSLRLAGFAVAMQMFAQLVYQYHRADHGGVRSLVPSTVLIAGAFTMPRELIISPPGFRDFTLSGRLANSSLSSWQRDWLFSRARTALDAGASAESVDRAATLLVRGGFEGEISLAAWQRAFSMLLSHSGLNTEAAILLAQSYLAARGDAVPPGLFSTPATDSRLVRELEPFRDTLLQELRSQYPGTPQWEVAIRLLVAGGNDEAVVAAITQAAYAERDPRAFAAFVTSLGSIGRRSPSAANAVVDLVDHVSGDARLFAIVQACRTGPDSPWAHAAFLALASSGEPNVELFGSLGLACSPTTRCEGTDLLIDTMRRARPLTITGLRFMLPAMLAQPADHSTSQILDELKRYATDAVPDTRLEAIELFAEIIERIPSRRSEIESFLGLLESDQTPLIARRVRELLAAPRSVANESELIRIAPE